MEMPELHAPDAAPAGSAPLSGVQKPCRRCGTVTFGLVMVVAGLGMLTSLFFPGLDFLVLLKLSPLALVILGAEVLLSARAGGRVRYDWVGMLLSTIIVCLSLALFAAAWVVVHHPDFYYYW